MSTLMLALEEKSGHDLNQQDTSSGDHEYLCKSSRRGIQCCRNSSTYRLTNRLILPFLELRLKDSALVPIENDQWWPHRLLQIIMDNTKQYDRILWTVTQPCQSSKSNCVKAHFDMLQRLLPMSTMHILCAHDSCIPSVTVQWTFKELKTWETTYHLCVMVESLFWKEWLYFVRGLYALYFVTA